MNISIIQPDILWESPGKNIEKYNSLIKGIRSNTDLVILPEMFTTGFSMNSATLAVSMNSPYLSWMKEKAAALNSALMGSLIIREDNRFYNRLVFINSHGKIDIYDKRHMFRMGGEGEHFSAGTKKLIVHHNRWKICPLICYDLRFPVWSRNREEYDLLIYVANWPAARSLVWNILLKARAIENQSWVVGVNRVGTDGENIEYKGESQVIDPKGNVKLLLDNREQVGNIQISLEELQKFRKKFPAWKDRDNFNCDW